MKKQIMLGVATTLFATASQAVILFDDLPGTPNPALTPADAGYVEGITDIPLADVGLVNYATEIDVDGTIFHNTAIDPITVEGAEPDGTLWGNLTVLIPSIQGLGNGENTRLRLDLIGEAGKGAPTFNGFEQDNLVVYGFSPNETTYEDQRPDGRATTRQCAANISIQSDGTSYILDINCEQGINTTDYFAVTFNVVLPEEQCVALRAGRYHTVTDAQNEQNGFYADQQDLFCFEQAVTINNPEKLHPMDFINPGDESAVDTTNDPVTGVRNSFMFDVLANGGDDDNTDDNTPISTDMSFNIAPNIFWNSGEEVVTAPELVLGTPGDGGATFVVEGDFTGFDHDGINLDNNGSLPGGELEWGLLDGSANSATFFDVAISATPNRGGLPILTDPVSFELNPEGIAGVGFNTVGIPGPMNPSAYHVTAQIGAVVNGAGGLVAGSIQEASEGSDESARNFISEIELGGAVDQANYILRATNRDAESPFTTFLRITNDTNCPADIYIRMIDDAGNSSYFDLGDVTRGNGTPFDIELDRYASTQTINADRFYAAAEAAALEHGYAFDADTAKARIEVVSTYAASTETRPNAFNGSGATSHNGEEDNVSGVTEDDYGAPQAFLEGFPAVDVQVITRSSDGTTFTYADTQD